MTIASGQQALASDMLHSLNADGYLSMATATELTIATGAITVTKNWYTVDTEADASTDDLDTITAGANVNDGHLLYLRSVDSARDIVLKHNTGNIFFADGLNVTLTNNGSLVVLVYDSVLVKWIGGRLGIGIGSISLTQLADSAAISVIGRSANSVGVPADIVAVTDGHVLRLSGTTLGFGTLATAGIANSAVTADKIATSVAGAGLTGGGGTALSVVVDGTSIQIVGDTLQGLFTPGLSSPSYINDTANANNTTGLTINQGAADDEVISLKSSDVAHGMTALTETDTYAHIKKLNATEGGLLISGYSEGDSCVSLHGHVTTDNTTKTSAAEAPVKVVAYLKSGTNRTQPGADANLFTIGHINGNQFIFDVEGSAHANVEWTTFDAHNDVALLEGLEMAFRDPVREGFGHFINMHRARLQELKIVNFYDDGPRAMVNFTRLSMLLVGAIRQTSARLDRLEQKLLTA